jgi:hypothetical protein
MFIVGKLTDRGLEYVEIGSPVDEVEQGEQEGEQAAAHSVHSATETKALLERRHHYRQLVRVSK